MKKNLLADRYNAQFLEIAQERRDKLNYTPLSYGQISDEQIKYVSELLFQLHQNYYLGFFETAICLSGVLLEQSLIIQLSYKLEQKGSLRCEYKKKIKGKPKTLTIEVRDQGSLNHTSLKNCIELAKAYQIIPQSQAPIYQNLQNIRNTAVHNLLPSFFLCSKSNQYICQYHPELEVCANEVQEHTVTQEPREIWAYYCISRTRECLATLFESRAKRLPPREFQRL